MLLYAAVFGPPVHAYVVPPLAVKSVIPPTQKVNPLPLADIDGTGKAFTVTVVEVTALHPAAFVTVTL